MSLQNKWLYLIVCIFVSACTSNGGGIDNPGPTSSIAVCGGGLDSGVKANIEASYEKTKGKLDTSFSKYVKAVLDANGVSDEKYHQYINCVLKIDERNRKDIGTANCRSSCSSIQAKCVSDTQDPYNECIREGEGRCWDTCRYDYGLSPKKCKKNCSPDKAGNKAIWERLGFCGDEIESTSHCNAAYTSCIATC